MWFALHCLQAKCLLRVSLVGFMRSWSRTCQSQQEYCRRCYIPFFTFIQYTGFWYFYFSVLFCLFVFLFFLSLFHSIFSIINLIFLVLEFNFGSTLWEKLVTFLKLLFATCNLFVHAYGYTCKNRSWVFLQPVDTFHFIVIFLCSIKVSVHSKLPVKAPVVGQFWLCFRFKKFRI